MQSLQKLDTAPDWLLEICREIDRLSFGAGFDHIVEDAELFFGVAHIRGRDAIAAFFIKIDSPLIVDHRVLETWHGGRVTFVRGEAEMAKRETPDQKLVAPFMWIFRRDTDDATSIIEWRVTAGPIDTGTLL